MASAATGAPAPVATTSSNDSIPDDGTDDHVLTHTVKEKKLRVVLVGDAAVGKSSLIRAFCQQPFAAEYAPTMADTWSMQTSVEDKKDPLAGIPIFITVADTSGSDEYEGLRKPSYAEANIVVLCFSVVSPNSFSRITKRWLDELQHNASRSPVMLLGLKTDLRDDKDTVAALARKNAAPLTTKHIEKQFKEMRKTNENLFAYRECSAKKGGKAVKEVVDEAISAGLLGRKSGLAKLFGGNKVLDLAAPKNVIQT